MSNSFAETLIKFISDTEIMCDDIRNGLNQTQRYLEEMRNWYRSEKTEETKSAGIATANLEKQQREFYEIVNKSLDELTEIYKKLI